MKKTIIAILFAIPSFLIGQNFTLEHTYDSASVWNTCQGNGEELMIVNFEVSGEHYVKINRCGKVIDIYDLNHSLTKTISMASYPTNGSPYYQLGDVLYLSEQLFDTDNAIELMYTVQNGNSLITNVYKDNGVVLFTDSGAPLVHPNYEMQQWPIYNTSQGTKMILSYTSGKARVFGLSGTLSSLVQQNNQSLLQSSSISNARPNPTNQSTIIDYKLPDNATHGEIVFFSTQGIEIRRFKVDRTFNSLIVSTQDLEAGTYYYQMQIDGTPRASKKLVVIR